MTRQSTQLFNKRSATQDFLFSRSEDATGKHGGGAFRHDSCDNGDDPLSARFPDMLDRLSLVEGVETAFKSAATLCAIMIRIDSRPVQTSGPDEGRSNKKSVAEVIQPIVAICRKRGGMWARIGRCRFALVFAHLGGKDGEELAKQMQETLAPDRSTTLTAGVAVYPTNNDPRAQIVTNAEKALDHAGFFGPGSITQFDAVSLNISGDRLYQVGDIQGAIAEFKKGLRLNPSDTNLLNSLGVCYGVIDDYANALHAFETAIWLAPDELMPVYNKGYVWLCRGKTQQALDCFLLADSIEPNVFEVVFHIGQIHLEAGAADKARPYLEAATRANNRSGSAYRHLGDCLDRLGLTKEAVQAYKSVVKIIPNDAESLSKLGRLYVKRGESLDVAAVFCEQSVQISPENGLFRYHLGCVYLEQGHLARALEAFELAARLGHDCRSIIEQTQDRMMSVKAS